MYGKVLRLARMKKGLSQEELAEQIGLSRSAVSRLENNKLELKVVDAVEWGRVTNATEMIAAVLCGIDLATIIQQVSSLMGSILYIW